MKILRRQQGFFDLGISFLILAIGGTVIFAKSPGDDAEIVEKQEASSVNVVVNE